MKSTILTITFVLLSFFSNAQIQYFSPNLYTIKVLDSLGIPYLPIKFRVRGEGFSQKFKSEYVSHFGEDLRYSPYTLPTDQSFKNYIQNKEMEYENDYMYVSILSNLNITVVGESVIPIVDEKNSSVIVLELFCKNSGGFEYYTVIVFYETKDGKFDYINENFELATLNGWSMEYE
jgi:hypothetical protein